MVLMNTERVFVKYREVEISTDIEVLSEVVSHTREKPIFTKAEYQLFCFYWSY